MKDEFLEKRISETSTEIFPLDRLLPLETVYSIFTEIYQKIEDKNIFFKDRKFQRLREGYFAMFVAISMKINSKQKEEYYLVFPSDPSNDFYITFGTDNVGKKRTELISYRFDLKEYTNYSAGFEEFINKNVIPKINNYEIAISTYRKIDDNDIKPLIDYLKINNIDYKIWLLGLPTENDYSYNISAVTIIGKDGILCTETINLDNWIDKNKTPLIFQDVIRIK